MRIKGPIKIIIEGPQASGKSQISDLIKAALFYHNIDWKSSNEGLDVRDDGQVVTIVEKQT